MNGCFLIFERRNFSEKKLNIKLGLEIRKLIMVILVLYLFLAVVCLLHTLSKLKSK